MERVGKGIIAIIYFSLAFLTAVNPVYAAEIEITWYNDDLDDDDSLTDDLFSTDTDEIFTNTYVGQLVYLKEGTLRQDTNGNLKLNDTSDYPLYSGLYVEDYYEVRPFLDVNNATDVYQDESVNSSSVFSSSKEDSKGYGFLGTAFKIRNTGYLITKETDSETVEVAPVLNVTAASFPYDANPKDYAETVEGTLKIAYKNESGLNGTLYFYDGDSLLKSLTIGESGTGANRGTGFVDSISRNNLPTDFENLKIFYKITSTNTSKITILAGNKSQTTTIYNGMTEAFGYGTTYLYSGPGVNSELSVLPSGLFLMDGTIDLVKEAKVEIPNTLFQLDLDIARNLDILKTETVVVANDSNLDYNNHSFEDFLNISINMTIENNKINITWNDSINSTLVSSGDKLKSNNQNFSDFLDQTIYVRILEKPDLMIYSSDYVTASELKKCVASKLNATVRNIEKSTSDTFSVSFYDGDQNTGTLIGTNTTTAGQNTYVTWTPTSSGTKTVTVVVDSANAIDEQDESNNVQTQTFSVDTGDFIEITRNFDDLDDDGSSETDVFKLTDTDEISTSTYTDYMMDLSGGLMKFDSNSDQKLDDKYDYILYSGLYINDTVTARPYLEVLNLTDNTSTEGIITYNSLNSTTVFDSGAEDSKGYGILAMAMEIKNNKYLIINETDSETADIAPLIAKTAVSPGAGDPLDYAINLSNNLKFAYKAETSGVGLNGTMYFYVNDALNKSLYIGGTSANWGSDYVNAISKSDLPDAFADLKIFYKISAGNWGLAITAGNISEKTTLTNGMTGAFGYNTTYLYTGSGNNPLFSKVGPGIYLIDDYVDMVKGDKVDIPYTLFQLDLDVTNSLDLVKKESLNVTSGSVLRMSKAIYSDFLSSTIYMTADNTSIDVDYYSDDLDTNASTTDIFAVGFDEISTATYEGGMMTLKGGLLKYDVNGNQKLNDTSDYPLYNGFYIIDKVTVQPYLIVLNGTDNSSAEGVIDHELSVNSTTVFSAVVPDSKAYGLLGLVMNIGGDKYLVMKENDTESVEFVPLLNASPSDVPDAQDPVGYTSNLTGDLKVAYNAESNYNGTLYFYNDTDLLKSLVLGGASTNRGSGYVNQIASADMPSEFQVFKVFYKITDTSGITVIAGEKVSNITINNSMTDVFGYNTLYIYSGTNANPEFSKVDSGIYLMGDPIDLVKDDKVGIPDTTFYIDLDISNSLDVLKKESVRVKSGSKMETTNGSYADFLSKEIRPVVWLNSLTCEEESPPPPPPSGGGGGGGPAPADTKTEAKEITPTEPEVITQIEAELPTIEKDKTGTIEIPEVEEMPLTEMEIKVNKKVSKVKVEVKVLTDKPAEVVKEIVGTVLKYLNIEHENIEDEDIETVMIKFKVEKEWTKKENIDPETVKLERYKDGEWKKLPTSKLDEDDNNIYYEAESPGLSVFGISGSVYGVGGSVYGVGGGIQTQPPLTTAPPETPKITPPPETPATEEEGFKFKGMGICGPTSIVLLALLPLIGTGLLRRKD